MGSDDRIKQSDEDKKRLLEEIRRRSEEAELKRIEEEESIVPEPPLPAPVPPSAEEPPVFQGLPEPPPAPPRQEFSPFPAPFPETPSSALSAEEEQRALILKEKFLIAIDRAKVEKAGELLSELNPLLPHEELLELRAQLHQLEEEKGKGKEKRRRAEPFPMETPEPERPKGDDQRKKIAALLEEVNTAYQSEKYSAALDGIAKILEIDGANEDALRLREEIMRAQQLAEQIAKEDAKRRQEEAMARSASRKSDRSGRTSSVAASDKDVWGTSVAASGDLGIEIAPEEKGPAAPPKPPVIDRIAEQVGRIKIPVKPLLIVLGAIVLLAAAYYVIDNIRNAVVPPRYSLLVLPAVGGGDSTLQQTAEGLTIDLIDDLACVGELRVIAPATSFALSASSLGGLQDARSVTSNFYLRWTLSRQGETLVLQAELYDTAATKPVWTFGQVSSPRELPHLKMEIARALVGAMGLKASDEELAMLKAAPTSNSYAYAAYLRAIAMARHPDLYPPLAVISALEGVVAADSSYARAQAALGWEHVLAYETQDPSQAQLAAARERVQQAVSLGLHNPLMYRVWGTTELLQSQYDKALERLEQAVSLAPSDAEAQRRLAIVRAIKNQPDAALKAANRAAVDDPKNLDSHTTLGLVQQFVAVLHGDNHDEYKAALQSFEQGMRLAPDRTEYGSRYVADILVYLQQPERALNMVLDRLARARQSYYDLYILGRLEQSAGKPKQEWQEVLMRAKGILNEVTSAEPGNAVALSQLALVHTRLGEFREAVAANQRALRAAPTDLTVLYNTARMYALQRDNARALEFLGKAIDRRYSLPEVLDRDLFNLHNEQDFLAIVTR